MRRLTVLILLTLSSQLQAAPHLYGELRLGGNGVRHSELDFYPTSGSVAAGMYVREGIGVEVFFDSSLSAGKKGAFEMRIPQAQGFALRLVSPPEKGVQGYLTLGYVDFKLEQRERETPGGRPIKENFTGARVSIGVEKRLRRYRNLLFGVEYRNYNSDSGITVDGLSVGFRINVQ